MSHSGMHTRAQFALESYSRCTRVSQGALEFQLTVNITVELCMYMYSSSSGYTPNKLHNY